MASGLRHIVRDYKKDFDLSPEVIRAITEKVKSPTWSSQKPFGIEIVEKIGPNMVKVHFCGYSNKYDQVMHCNELVINEKPEGVNGPVTLQSFISVLKMAILKELGCGTNADPHREIRMETTDVVLSEVLKVLSCEKFGEISLEQMERLLGDQFYERIDNSIGDYSTIESNITARIFHPKPEVVFKRSRSLVLEHHCHKNPIFVAKFSVKKVSARASCSPELK